MAQEFLLSAGINRWWFSQYATPRTVADGVTNSSTTVTSATAAFSSFDVGAAITGAGIPGSTTIASVTNATTVVLSAAATATASGVSLTITRTASNGIAGFQAALIADWGPSGTVSAQLPSTFQLYTNSSSPTTAIFVPNNQQAIPVLPSQYLGYNQGNWQVVPASQMNGSVYTAATV